MKIEENIKIKNLLKGLFENQEFETTYQDEVTSWDDEEEVYEEYTFKYYIEVGKVLGEGTKTVASINIIITEFTNDGEDKMLVWKEEGYNENDWYILELDRAIYEEKMQDIPISIYPTFYSQEEYDNLPSDQKNL
jgi:hypothetical protein